LVSVLFETKTWSKSELNDLLMKMRRWSSREKHVSHKPAAWHIYICHCSTKLRLILLLPGKLALKSRYIIILFYKAHTDRLWGPHSLMCNGYRGSLRVKCGRSVMLYTHPLLVPRLKKSRSCTSSRLNCHSWRVAGPIYFIFKKKIKLTYRKLTYRPSVRMYTVSHVTRNPPTGKRRLCSALWPTRLPVVHSLLLRHAVVTGSTVNWTLCILSETISQI
jgi:hypothetical protein